MIEQHFHEVFGAQPKLVQQSPGRVNLIGEHIDYNGGSVLPCAITLGLTIAIRPRDDDLVRVKSAQFEGIAEGSLSSDRRQDWAGHAIRSVIFAVRDGLMDGGADIVIESTMPDGAGLSSSAALVVGILKAARAYSGANMSNENVARLAQEVENKFIGVPCGIMDQMAVAVSHPGQAIALDTNTLSYNLIDLPAFYHMAVVHSGIRRRLSDGRYKERKEECDEALRFFASDHLCLVSDEELQRSKDLSPNLRRRVIHCVTEHQRSLAAASSLKVSNIQTFGRLMNESHRSMRDDFEMSTPEIDALVSDAVTHGAIGARLTGGGFGGCIVACVATDRFAAWRDSLLSQHPSAQFVC